MEAGFAVPLGVGTYLTVFIPDADPTTTTNPFLKDTDRGGLEDNIEDWNRNGKVDPSESDPNESSDDIKLLTVDPLTEGGTATFHFFGCVPKSSMYLGYSLVGSGPTAIGNYGIVMDLSDPIHLSRPFQINSQGRAVYGPVAIPPMITVGMTLWFQGLSFDPLGAVQLDITNMVPSVVE